VAKTRGFRKMELELFGYLGDLKPGDVSHPARCEATRPGVLVQAWRLADGQAETASVPRANS
jgi:hypothetical protein